MTRDYGSVCCGWTNLPRNPPKPPKLKNSKVTRPGVRRSMRPRLRKAMANASEKIERRAMHVSVRRIVGEEVREEGK